MVSTHGLSVSLSLSHNIGVPSKVDMGIQVVTLDFLQGYVFGRASHTLFSPSRIVAKDLWTKDVSEPYTEPGKKIPYCMINSKKQIKQGKQQ